jgi:hypothetical protein
MAMLSGKAEWLYCETGPAAWINMLAYILCWIRKYADWLALNLEISLSWLAGFLVRLVKLAGYSVRLASKSCFAA